MIPAQPRSAFVSVGKTGVHPAIQGGAGLVRIMLEPNAVWTASCSLYGVWEGLTRGAVLRKCASFGRENAYTTNGVGRYLEVTLQCRVEAVFRAVFLAAALPPPTAPAANRPSTASRPAARMSSESS